ncbi:Cd2+/Zn2+-exporting ATPase [Gracilimonas mengyeensis]|uniref:P-type Zn(2+) transporter n=2 Tax=Gracilimonas mengyeensis TaxID=1302730 RepID=A0A521D374_9BACT|nr:cation-translocating P-type ATPase [Gracilimonas mengyeensis]SMO66107.1 Cd2+/Zn2+-exporting ATPase [Gracilimonas mengyeensis]
MMTLFSQFTSMFKNPTSRKKILLIVSGISILSGWFFFGVMEATFTGNALMILAALVAGYEIIQKAWLGLKNRQTNIELLVSIAAIGGLLIGIYWESAAVTFLFLLGGWLESRTLQNTRKTLKNLVELVPETATIVREDETETIPAQEVEKDMLVQVKPGGRIPVDGKVESGESSVDESAITGESIPVDKKQGSKVFAGTINQNGRIFVRAGKAGADTTLAKIIRRVEEAQDAKAPTQRFIERFARWYTPGIVGLSVISFIITQNIELAITLLVIGCPGALVISTPISVITGIGRAAKEGILIKGGEYLENAGKISALAFDKTGTLTQGKPKVTEVFSLQSKKVPDGFEKEVESEITEDEVLYWAGIAESGSEHPLAKAILEEARNRQEVPEADSFQSYTGFGVSAGYLENEILVGNPSFMKEKNIRVDDEALQHIEALSGKGRTVVLVAKNGELIGGLGLFDTIRPDAPSAIRKLREIGIEELVMLTGDTDSTAQSIAEEVGIKTIYSRMFPEDKHKIIEQLKADGHRVAMVGDGINDALALTDADIGIAMGAAGTDVAIESADIALMADDLTKIPEALSISKLTLRNIRQNVVIALITVAALLTGVFAGEVHMAGGMLIHELSVMLVILNGMRLKWMK